MLTPLRASTPMTRTRTLPMRISFPSGDCPWNNSRTMVWPTRQTEAAARTSRSVKGSPSARVDQLRTVRNSGVVPRMLVGDQLRLPKTHCMRQSTLGAAIRTALHSRAMASQSAGVSVMRPPLPELAPALTASLGSTCTTLAPMAAMVRWRASEEPWPISTMVMTAAMPMVMPRQVRMERMALRRRAWRAVRVVRRAERMGDCKS